VKGRVDERSAPSLSMRRVPEEVARWPLLREPAEPLAAAKTPRADLDGGGLR
jgi:hypothetical protein